MDKNKEDLPNSHQKTPFDMNILEEISTKLNNLENNIKVELSKSNHQHEIKDETIHRLHNTIREHEKGLVFSIKEPILRDLIMFKDSFNKFKQICEEKQDEILMGEIDFLEEELNEIFYRHSLETIKTENNQYNRDLQVSRKQIETNDLALNRIVDNVLKEGYTIDGKILRKQEVSVFIYKETNN